MAALALEFCILNAPRTMEVLHSRLPEIDRGAALWTIPEERMKAGDEHRVPLSADALRVVEKADEQRTEGDLIFPGRRRNKPLSSMAMLMLVRRMGHTDEKGQPITVHGFRSTFRDWAADCTNFPSEVVEMALAHAVKDEVEAAYRRGELLAKRRALMAAWADFCSGKTNVVPITSVAA
jgi:integrase